LAILSPFLNELSPDENQKFSTKSNDSGDIGHTGEKSDILIEEKRNKNYLKETSSPNRNDLIRFIEPFYYCIEHHQVQNINLKSIIHHLLYFTEHTKGNENK
jgi:hypothetical protein